ncbi:uracil-DNA glycosylase family protein [Prevotella sp.]|uniref:uracil-DNA glycosylase family protein n=1 Tax=Prevotella sp. TaxID=59823 RepID=UPI002A820E7B|nr:uracil-DNA glycosylase family protein [Prevotella sp.]MDY4644140.1 uracil-DNA glycosylase family protein [Prevotella sp.]
MFPVERHPFEPFLPEGCRLLMLGSFPPAEKRWSMHFYYPNFTNDMWRIFGLCFFGDKLHFVDVERKTFYLDAIIDFLTAKGIGMYDTATAVRRLKNTAADKDLEVVEPTDLKAMVRSLPRLEAIVTTGQKATDVLRECFDISGEPRVGEYVEFEFEGRMLRLWRMPSSSRAYPLNVEKKAEYYGRLFEGLLFS